MLDNINLKKKLSREEFKRVLPMLQKRLYDLEKASWDHGASTIVIFEGWDASGKGRQSPPSPNASTPAASSSTPSPLPERTSNKSPGCGVSG